MGMLTMIQAWLQGRKTYLGLIALGISGLFWTSGHISNQTEAAIISVVGALTGISMRLAVAKAETKGDQPPIPAAQQPPTETTIRLLGGDDADDS